MRTSVGVVTRPEFMVEAVTCSDDHTGWSTPEAHTGHAIVLVRRGRFRLNSPAGVVDVDHTVGYLSAPTEEQRFSHPAGGDVCTSVGFSPTLWQALVGDRPARTRSLYVDGRLELAHRRLLTAARGADVDYAAAEELVRLLAETARRTVAAPDDGPRRHSDRALVVAAREAVLADHPAARGLLPLADELGVSPYRLSRAFPRELGVSLTRYRNRVRIGRGLERLERGERNLAGLAVDLGFADQAHLCRTVREHLGHTPTALSRMLR